MISEDFYRNVIKILTAAKKCRFTGIPWLQSVAISHGMIILSMFFDNPPPSLADAFAP